MVGVQEESLGWKQGLEWIGMIDLVFKPKSLIEFGSSFSAVVLSYPSTLD